MATILSNIRGIPPAIQKTEAFGATIRPGHVLFKTSATLAQVNPLLGVKLPVPWIAVEKPGTGDIDLNYNAGEDLFFYVPARGDVALLWLRSGETTAYGSLLEIGGAGGLRVASDPSIAIGHALEAITNPPVDTRIKVEIA